MIIICCTLKMFVWRQCSSTVRKTKQNRSKRCRYIQSNMTFSGCCFFAIFYRNYLLNRQNIIKFVISGSELVEIDTSLARLKKKKLAAILIFSKTRFSIMAEVTYRFCWFCDRLVSYPGGGFPLIRLHYRNRR